MAKFEPPIWESKLDDKYLCRVTRTEPYVGLLEIIEGEEVVLSESVPLSYDAKFGPDVFDLSEWQDRCVEFIDGRSE
jgi:hypothetical protein